MAQTLGTLATSFGRKSTSQTGQSPYPLANPTAFQRHNACVILIGERNGTKHCDKHISTGITFRRHDRGPLHVVRDLRVDHLLDDRGVRRELSGTASGGSYADRPCRKPSVFRLGALP